VELAWVPPLVGAAAQAIPGVISLLSAHRKVSSKALTVENLAAAASTAGALRTKSRIATVVHDDFRLLPHGEVYARVVALTDERKELVACKLELEQHRSAVAGHEKTISDANTRIGLIDAVVAAIDQFASALRTIPAGGTRSPLATAALREQLHSTPAANGKGKPIDPHFSHVLLVKANPGSAQQVVEDRLLRKDKFTVVAIVNVSYVLIATSDSHVLAAGNASAMATGQGTIGTSFEVEVKG
jgi:hypothetical protein